MIMPIGAVPLSRVVWKNPDQPDDPFALGEDEDLAGEAHAEELVPGLDDHAAHRVDPAPAGDRLVRDERFALGDTGHNGSAMEDDQLRPPFQRPVSAASTHSSSVPNQASMPRIAGR